MYKKVFMGTMRLLRRRNEHVLGFRTKLFVGHSAPGEAWR